MKHCISLILLLAIVACSKDVKAQQTGNLEGMLNNTALPYYESLYVHTDRNNYQPGDTLFLRGDLFSAVLNKQMLNSRFIYVDLVDNSGAVLHREKVALDTVNGSFNGYFPLHSELESGIYTLNGYTYFMQNLGKEYFFTKKVGIGGNPVLSEVLLTEKSDLKLESSRGSNSVTVELSVPSDSEIRSSNVSVSVVALSGSELEASPNKNGYQPFDVDGLVDKVSSIKEPEYSIELSTVLSGYVVNRKGKIEANAKIAFIGEDNRAYYAHSDGEGYIECPVEWDNATRFYSRKEGDFGFHDVMLKQNEPDLICDVHDSPSKNPYAWTDKEVVLDVYEYPMSGAPSSVRMPMGSADALGSAGETSRYRGERNVSSVYKSFTAASDNTPTNVVVKKKRKFNIQRVVNGVQRQDVEFVYSGGATRYWNPNAVVKKGESFEISFPAGADVDSYV